MKQKKKKEGVNTIDIERVNFIVKIKGEGKLRATAIMEYKNMRVKGFRIANSDFVDEDIDEKIWIQVPSFFAGKYHDMFFLEPKEEWAKLKKKLYKEYLKADKEYYGKKFKMEKEVDIDSIKFD